MLKIFDKNHNAIGHIVKYKDCKIESELSTGDKTLFFTYLASHHNLTNEMYVRTKDDEFVIKEVPGTTGSFPQIVAVLNLEELQKDMWQTFSVTDVTIDEAVRTVLAGTGWTIGECNVTKRRNAGMMQVSSLEVIQNLCKAFMCDPVFDTINKKVSFYVQRGEDKGVYFMSGLNLKNLQKKSTSYDYYTRIIPIGANGMTIESVNDGKNYLENYQYSNKALTYIWKDESYTDAQALKDDAEMKLNDLSKPTLSYSAYVRDLAKQKAEYAILSYNIGDSVTLIDRETGTRDKQRIVKLVEYPQDSEKNTCELANTVLTFEEMQQKVQEAANIINYTISGDGRYTGTINVSDILHFEQGISGSTTISGINGSISTMQGDLAQVKMTVGEIDANYIKADEADLKYATIENLNVTNETVHSIQGDYASFKSTVTNEFAATNADITNLTGRFATFEQTTTDELIAAKGWMLEGSIGSAQISSVDANKIKSGTIDTAIVTIAGSDGRLQISDNTIQISDANRVRVQAGKDASGDYTLAVWDSAGNLIWDALGATENTIQRKIIRDKMVADDAAIKALKLDLQSINTALTDQGVTISGTVVQVGDKTLNVELSEKTQLITEQGEKLTDHATRIAANENAISLRVTTQVYESYKSTVDGEIASAKSRLSTAESSITAMDGKIAMKVEQTDIDTAVNNLQVGGRNLLRQTKDYSFEGINARGNSTIQSEKYHDFTVRYLNCNGGDYSEMSLYVSAVTPEGGAQYVFSFYAKGTGIRAHFFSGGFKPIKSVSSTGSINYATDGQIDIALTSEWKRYWIVYTLEDTNTLETTGNKHVLLRVVNGYEAYACGLMFEKGNKPSNWTPAPEDTESSISAVQTIAEQTATKFSWLVKSGTSSTDFTLTDRTASLVADYINLNGKVTFSGLDSSAQSKINTSQTTANAANTTLADWCYNNDKTYINGGKIYTGTITAVQIASNAITTVKLAANAVTTAKLATDAIKSTNYAYTSGNYSTAGTFLDLSTGIIRSKNFAVDSSGNAYLNGTINATSGKIGNFTISESSIYATYSNGLTFYAGGTDYPLAIKSGTTLSGFYVDSDGKLTSSTATIKVGTNSMILSPSGTSVDYLTKTIKGYLFNENYYIRGTKSSSNEFYVTTSSEMYVNSAKVNSFVACNAFTPVIDSASASTYAIQLASDKTTFDNYAVSFEVGTTFNGSMLCKKPFDAAAVTNGTPMVFSSNGYMRKGSSSSKRYKNHVRNMMDADVSKLYDLSPVWFTYKDGYLDDDDINVGKPIPGFYAEDVLECFPNAVRYNASGQVEDWDYKTMIPAMMMMVQSQRKEWTTAVDAVKNDVDCLRAKTESEVDSLKSHISSLQYQLEQAYMHIATLEKQQQAAG